MQFTKRDSVRSCNIFTFSRRIGAGSLSVTSPSDWNAFEIHDRSPCASHSLYAVGEACITKAPLSHISYIALSSDIRTL
ncbi:unnamed protein product [Amoebophrya sp. A25]|nr:unnamed protein product [Amoebophrya sp. A25]|eukprot:GSA25T00013007001.1